MRQVIATMPGTNHCSAEPSETCFSRGVNRARNTSGWIIAKTTDIGSRHTGCTLKGSAPGMKPTWNTVAETGDLFNLGH